MTEYATREIGVLVREALEEMPVVVITGMRQTGKSTFLLKDPALAKRRYKTLDDFAQLAAAREAPEIFLDVDGPLTIDEAHKCPELLTAIKAAVDRRREPGRFLLSGSANFPMLKGISESLAGRAVYLDLLPFTRRELAGSTKARPFLRRLLESGKAPVASPAPPIKLGEILDGGMPSVCLGEVKNRRVWFKGFEQTYLDRDVRELSRIGDIISFRNLLHLTAMRTGQLLSPSQLARDAKISVSTLTRHLSLMETSFIFRRLPPYLRNRASRLIKSPKLYLTDSGLACHLAGIQDFKSRHEEALKGHMFETHVAQNLAGTLASAWPEAELFFWNVQGRYEVDFVIESQGRCLALEVKLGSRWTDRDLAGLRAFLDATPHCDAAVLAHNGPDSVRLGPKLWALPLAAVLS